MGLLIIEGMLGWYEVFKRSLSIAKVKRQDLEIGRTVFQFLSSDIQFCGYRGFRTLDPNFPIRVNFHSHKAPYKFYRYDIPVFGFRNTPGICKSYLPSKSCERIKDNTDVILIYNIARVIDSLKEAMQTPEDVLKIQASKKMRKGSIILISDHERADLFVGMNFEPGRIFHELSTETTSHEFSKAYGLGAEVIELETVIYYLGVSERSTPEETLYVLFRDDLFQKGEELIGGIRDLVIEYRVSEPTMGLEYRRSETMSNFLWPWVEGVRFKIVTVEGRVWDYEFSIRNRLRIGFSAYFSNSHFDGNYSFDDTMQLKLESFNRLARTVACNNYG